MTTKERTLSIIKPDAVAAGNAWNIIQLFTDGGLRPVAMKLVRLTRAQAEGFYAVHRERPFFASLVEFMTSGPITGPEVMNSTRLAKNGRSRCTA